MSSPTPYRESHTAPGYGQRYNRNYSKGYYSAVYREIEIPLLQDIFRTLSKKRSSLLDFACGTGRITRLAPPFFQRVVGVDISQEMLACAAPINGEEYRLRDIIAEPLEEKFDIVTSFRFFLNAEPDLRRLVLHAIRNHLAHGGRLVCNIHMNSNSPLGLVYRLTRWLKLPTHNTLSRDEFERTLRDSGFEVEDVYWYSVLPRPGPLFARLLDRAVGPSERMFARIGLQGRFAQSFIVVARVANAESAAVQTS